MILLDQFFENVRKYPDKVVLADELEEKRYKQAELDAASGRVYAYLKNKGIGREDKVVIMMSRSCRYIAVMLGILRAGAVMVPLEKGYPEDRLEFILEDCKPKLVLDDGSWEDILAEEPLRGYEERDLHDGAYIIYTSGSTGRPKGVFHEVGSLERMMKYYDEDCHEYYKGMTGEEYDLIMASDNALCVSPFYFLAGLIYVFTAVFQGCFLYIISYESYKNVVTFKRILLEEKITSVFLTPSYISILDELKTPYLLYIYVGAERVVELYNKDVPFYNSYGMTEAGLAISSFCIDRPYDNTPAGIPKESLHLGIFDENDALLPQGEVGEIAFDSIYCRGYLNLPEQTAAAFRNGRFYTGDLGKILPDGNLLVLGRKDDMIKINGNRVEPGEIEAAVRDVLGLKWVYVQAFSEKGRSFICAYYTDDVTVNSAEVIEKLSKILPSYMIPIYYIKIDEIPKTISGKVDRQAFKAPDVNDFRAPYLEPRTREEKALCRAFAEVLEQEKVGILDDFYELGGDSLSAMEILSECNLPGLDAVQIFKYRTVEKIIENYMTSAKKNLKDVELKNREAQKGCWPLLPHQQFFFDMQMKTPDALEYNICSLVRFRRFVTPHLLRRAVTMVIRNHPAFFTTLCRDENGGILQHYTPGAEKKIEIEWISDRKLMEMKDSLPKPFPMLHSRLYECRIFVTEKGVYLFLDMHHIITDATSLNIFMAEVKTAYLFGKLKPDYYYAALSDHKEIMESVDYLEAKKYLERTYDGFNTPHMGRDTVLPDGMEEQPVIPLDVDPNALKKFLKKHALSRSEFFMGVAGLAQAVSVKKPDIGHGWTYSGRDSLLKQNICSCLITQLVNWSHLYKYTTVDMYFDDLKDQARKNIENSFYPFAFDIIANFTDAMTFIYQSDLLEFATDERLCRFIDIDISRHATDSFMQVDILDDRTGIKLFLNYNTGYFATSYVNAYIEAYKAITDLLLKNCDRSELKLSALLKEYGYDTWVK